MIARQWLRFHGALILPTATPGLFDAQLAEFRNASESRGLAAITIGSYANRLENFLRWASERHNDLSFISINDVDDYLASYREAGRRPITIRSQCIALRAFFIVAEVGVGVCRAYGAASSGRDSPCIRRLPRGRVGRKFATSYAP